MAVRMQRHLGSVLPTLRYEPVRTQVRALLDGHPVIDTRSAVLVWEPRRVVPAYAVPVGDLAAQVRPVEPQPDPPGDDLPPVLGPEHFEPHTSPGVVADVVAEDRTLEKAAFLLQDGDLDGLALVDFDAFDSWLVEAEPLVGHPRDPFKRIDVLATDRHVQVALDGHVLADSRHPLVLLETPLPVARYYLPRDDVRTDLLVASEHRTTCAYKGHASYLSTADGSEAGRDVAWTYPDPLDDALRVRDHVCFWAERTDLTVDGVHQSRPVTPWSPPDVLRRHYESGAGELA